MLYIVRHGQTDWNVQQRMQGQTNIKLNENGRAQAQKMKEQLKDVNFDKIISSDLDRAKETASIINEGHNKEILFDKRLREFSFGKLEGVERKDITEETWKKFDDNPALFEAESKEDVYKRIKNFMEEINKDYQDSNILVVSHGGPIRMIKYYMENPEYFDKAEFLKLYSTMDIKNLGLFTIDQEMKEQKDEDFGDR